MSRLLSEIKQQDEAAAAVLEEAELHTDSDIQSLTREELHELLPGNKKFQLRRTIFKIIHKQKPVDQVLKELKEFIPSESFRDALTNNVVLADYLPILKTQVNHVQSLLDAHVSILEGFSTNQPNQQSVTSGPHPVSHNGQPDGLQQGAPDSLPGPSTSDASGEMGHYTGPTGGYPQGPQSTNTSATYDPMESHHGQSDGGSQGTSGTSTSATGGQVQSVNDQTDGGPQGAQGKCTSATDDPMDSQNGQTNGGSQGTPAKLKYRMVVSGKTFDADLKLMQRVKDQVQNQLQLVERDQDHKITFVFCPICSRVASDVEAAMTDVKDDKPVILVLMHHTREVKYTSPLKTWHDNNNVVLFVHVFFHETIKGLLTCEENNAAVSKIQNKLLERFFPGSIDSRGNPQGMGAGGLTGNTSGRGGGNYRGSDVDSRSSGRSMFQGTYDYISSKK